MNSNQVGRTSTSTGKYSASANRQADIPPAAHGKSGASASRSSAARSKKDASIPSSSRDVQALPRMKLGKADRQVTSGATHGQSKVEQKEEGAARDRTSAPGKPKKNASLPSATSTSTTLTNLARDLNAALPARSIVSQTQAPLQVPSDEQQSALRWARALAQAAPPISVTKKLIYDDLHQAPFCLYELDDLHWVNKLICSSIDQYMKMNTAKQYADIQRWHEWINSADTDPSLSDEARRELVKNAFALMYRNGSPAATVEQTAARIRAYAADLAFLSSRHGMGEWFSYDCLVKSILDREPTWHSLFMRCATMRMIQGNMLEYAIRPDASGKPVEMIRPVAQQPHPFEISPLLRELVVLGMYAAAFLEARCFQALRELGLCCHVEGLEEHERAYLDGMEQLIANREVLDKKELKKLSEDLTNTFLNQIPRERRNKEKKWLRSRVAFLTMCSRNQGKWFDMYLLCSDLHRLMKDENIDLVFVMAILRRELEKGTMIQAQRELFFTAGSQSMTVYLRSYKHRHVNAPTFDLPIFSKAS